MVDRTVSVRLRADVAGFVSGFRTASQSAKTFSGNMLDVARKNEQAFNTVGKTLVGVGAASAAGLGLAAKAAISWESAWAGVTKTVDGSAGQMAQLEGELRNLATTLPATHGEIAAVAEAAGALGIKREDVAGFTKTMVDLGESTNLSAEQAANGLARLGNIMQTPQSEAQRLGSTLVELGNAGASTESEILELGTRLAAAGQIAGLSEADVLAFASTLSSVGVEAEAGGTALSKVFTSVRDAVLDGGDQLETFAKVAGVSVEQFKTRFEQDAAGAISLFIAGLGRMNDSGQSTTAVFEELELTDQRLMRALLSTAGAGDLLNQQLKLGNRAWEENTALAEEANKRYETAESRIKVARNQLVDFGITLGGFLLPALAAAADKLGAFISFLDDLPEPVKALGVAFGGAAGSLALLAGGAALGLSAMSNLVSSFSTVGSALEGVGVSAGGAREALKLAGVVGAIAGVIGAVDYLSDRMRGLNQNSSAVSVSLNEWATGGELAGAAAKLLGDDLDLINDAMQRIGSPKGLQGFENFSDQYLVPWSATGDDARKRIEEVDQALTHLATSGSGEQAAQIFKNITDRAKEKGLSLKEVKALYPEYQDALRAAKGSEEGFADASGATADALDGVGDSASGATGDVNELGDAVVTAADKLEVMESLGKALTDELDLLSGAQSNSLRTSAAFEESVASANQALADAQREVADAHAEVSEAQADVAATAEESAQRIADAQRSVSEAQAESAESAEQSAERIADAQSRVEDARESAAEAAEDATERVRDAELRLVDAQRQARDAQLSLSDARKEAVQDLKDMRDLVSDQALTREGAEISLLEARQALRDTQRDKKSTTPLDLRRARLRVAEAEARLEDVRRDGREAQDELNRAEKAGVDGSEKVIKAKEDLADANRGVSDASELVREAIGEERRQQQESAEAIREAIRGVGEARREAAKNAERSASRIAEAQQGLARAEVEANKARAESLDRVREAQNKAAEAERKANIVRGQVRDKLLDIADAAKKRATALYIETGDQKKATEALKDGREELVKAGIKYGLTREEAKKYADQILGTPKKWATIFDTPGIDKARKDVEKLQRKIRDLKDKKILVRLEAKGVRVAGVTGRGGVTEQLQADGGFIRGPGGPRDDAIPARLSDGEFVEPAHAVDYYGAGVFEAMRQKRIPRDYLKKLPAFRDGGLVNRNNVTVNFESSGFDQARGTLDEVVADLAESYLRSAGKRVRPVSGGYISQGFSSGHPGTDFAVPSGTPVKAMMDGVVSLVRHLTYSYGKHVRMDHADGYGSLYAHLSSIGAELGEYLPAGGVLGRVGSTGNSTGAHLHAEVTKDGQRVNPLDFIAAGNVPSAPTSSTGNQAIVRELAASRYGWTGNEWNALYRLIMGESGFRNTAQNPTSTAYGMFQFLDSTWGAYGATKTSDPFAQAVAGLRYIDQRYGSPSRAYSAWLGRNPHWYSEGGPVVADAGAMLPPGYSTVYNGTGQNEPALPAREFNTLRALAQPMMQMGPQLLRAAAASAGGDSGHFTGNLYLSSGELLGVVDGRIKKHDRDVKRRVLAGRV